MQFYFPVCNTKKVEGSRGETSLLGYTLQNEVTRTLRPLIALPMLFNAHKETILVYANCMHKYLPYTVRQGNRRSGWEVLTSPLVLRNFLLSSELVEQELHADTIAVYDKAPVTKSDASFGRSCLWNNVGHWILIITCLHNITPADLTKKSIIASDTPCLG